MSGAAAVRIEPLALHAQAVPLLARWFEAEWPAYYGPGGRASARRDLERYASAGGVPFALVALHEGVVCGVAALKPDSIPSHAHLSPWIGGALVRPDLRRRGIGAALVQALERHAAGLGFARLYCATGTAASLLERCGWRLAERVVHEGEPLAIYARDL